MRESTNRWNWGRKEAWHVKYRYGMIQGGATQVICNRFVVTSENSDGKVY